MEVAGRCNAISITALTCTVKVTSEWIIAGAVDKRFTFDVMYLV